MDTFAPDPAALAGRIRDMIDTGRLNAAQAVLAALRRLTPDDSGTAALAARLGIAAGRLDDALTALDPAIAADPADAGLRRLRADVHHRRGEHVAAAIDAAEAVALDPTDPSGKAILGVLMHELGRPLDAIACLAEALAAEPGNPAFVEAMAAAQAAAGTLDRAAATLAAGIARIPPAPALRNAAMLLEIRRRDFPAAVRLGEAARAAGAADACGFGLLGHALSSLARHDEAAAAYEEALKLAPEDPYVRHLVATAGARPGADRAPSPYVRAVFDGYADRFESHLIALGYRIPGLVRAALVGTDAAGPLLDLGCGTGLVGLALADLPLGPLHGVDLSPRMLARAAAKNLYAALHEADLLTFLETPGADYGVIVAADVLCYFGDLAPVFTAVAPRLRPGGRFLISCETDPAAPAAWALGPQGRYTHHPDHLRDAAAAAGLGVTTLRQEIQRFQNDSPVPGLFGVLTR